MVESTTVVFFGLAIRSPRNDSPCTGAGGYSCYLFISPLGRVPVAAIELTSWGILYSPRISLTPKWREFYYLVQGWWYCIHVVYPATTWNGVSRVTPSTKVVRVISPLVISLELLNLYSSNIFGMIWSTSCISSTAHILMMSAEIPRSTKTCLPLVSAIHKVITRPSSCGIISPSVSLSVKVIYSLARVC